MSHPQSAIIPDHAQAGIFIEADISDGRNEDIKSACRLSLESLAKLKTRFPNDILGLTIAFGSRAWQLFGHTEEHGLRLYEDRGLDGFVDGTENPQGDDNVRNVAIIPEGKPDAGGSYVLLQKYLHDMNAWRKLPVAEQEKVIGRSKQDDIEMDDDTKPANSHIALANVGDEFKVVRDNMPFGRAGANEMGTYFIAYARTFSTVKKMLDNMFIGNPEGNYDRILDFSTAHTGTLFFVPTMDMLDEFAE